MCLKTLHSTCWSTEQWRAQRDLSHSALHEFGVADTSLSWNPERNSVTGRPTDNGGAFVKLAQTKGQNRDQCIWAEEGNGLQLRFVKKEAPLPGNSASITTAGSAGQVHLLGAEHALC